MVDNFIKLDNNYKATAPENTIKRIRDILYNNDIFTIERSWVPAENNISSVKISIAGLPCSTNGKGTTEKYALASGYGEFMERLQNLALMEGYSGNKATVYPFPDAVPFDAGTFMQTHPRIWNSFFDGIEAEEALAILENEKKLKAVPFYNVQTGTADYLPYDIIYIATGSNGMCAGNTPEEALIQGLSELFERYIIKKIFFEDVLFPTVPESYLRSLPHWKYIEILNAAGFEVIVKDCSCNGMVPVATLIVKKGNKARMNCGASPDFSIALLRTIMEIFQGINLDSLEGVLSPLDPAENKELRRFSTAEKDYQYQYFRTLESGSGVVPGNLLKDSGTFDPAYLLKSKDVISRETLDNMMTLAAKLDFEVYIRDVSFLGFPAYYIYIPGVSEIKQSDYQFLNLLYKDFPRVKKTFYNMDQAPIEDLEHLAGVISNLLDNPAWKRYSIIPTIHNLSFKQTPFINKIEPENFLVAVYYKTGKYDRAHGVLRNYLQHVITTTGLNPDAEQLRYYFCFLEILDRMADGAGLEDAVRDSTFPEEITQDIYRDLSDSTRLFSQFGIPRCVDCPDCPNKSQCNYTEMDNLMKRLMDAMRNNPLDQTEIAACFPSAVPGCVG